jgi:hypothetical protein
VLVTVAWVLPGEVLVLHESSHMDWGGVAGKVPEPAAAVHVPLGLFVVSE